MASGRRHAKALVRLGWGIEAKAGKGSHIVLVKGIRRVTLPGHREVRRGTLAAVLTQAGISHEEYLNAYR